MSAFCEEFITDIAGRFSYPSRPVTIKQLTSGNVNVTFKLGFDNGAPAVILQRINTVAFKDPDALMENIRLVTRHIAARPDTPEGGVLVFIPAKDGSMLVRDSEGGCWRSYVFVDNVTAYDSVDSPEIFYEAGRGFGMFQASLSDFPADRLSETIPHFHDTPKRYADLLAAAEADVAGRKNGVCRELAFFDARKDALSGITSRLASGELPLRVTHNDTKLNNVLMDNKTRTALCVIDLDTVMPGSSLYDYGDAIRYGAATAAEDEPDLEKIDVNMDLFRAFTRGFIKETAGGLTPDEIRLLPMGIHVITCELAMRFLTDYLNGDVYFKINYPEHNLVRARAQIRLCEKIEERLPEMYAFCEQIARA